MASPPPLRTPTGIAYWAVGEGTTVLTIHGGPGMDHSFFRPYLDPLSRDRQVVYFDLPGHGQSSPAKAYGLEAMAMAIEDVRTSIGAKRVSVLGSSYGGFLSLVYALRNPHSVQSLILVDTSASYGFREESTATARRRATTSMLAALERLWDGTLEDDAAFRAAWREVLPLYFHRLPLENIQRLADKSAYRLDTRKRILPTFEHYDVRDALPTIAAPSLVMVGRHDWITSVAQAEELAAGLPNGELTVFEESGHYPFIEENETFIEKVRAWLTKHHA